jgi:hypothetical protein
VRRNGRTGQEGKAACAAWFRETFSPRIFLRRAGARGDAGTFAAPRRFFCIETAARTAMARTKQARKAKVAKVMREHKRGKLESGSGKKVKSRKQAIAIAMSESGQSRSRRKRGKGSRGGRRKKR